ADLAKRLGAELVLLHAYQLPGVATPEAVIYRGRSPLDRLIKAVVGLLGEWKSEALGLGAPEVTTHAASGVAYAEIVRFAEEQACDLIVMGTHGRTAVHRMLVGSTAERVVRHAPCPVLTVRQAPAARGEPTPRAPG
ncbi:MAG TPA: universal stress protein, partial [Myxococcales bacterium]|nr:universal stress protein [Myxococcales bacterium]